MKKLIAFLLILIIASSLFSCGRLFGTGTEPVTDDQTVTETEAVTETDEATETTVEYTADQLFEMRRSAYEKTCSYDDLCMKIVMDQQIYLVLVGEGSYFIKTVSESDEKVKDASKEEAAAEIHQTVYTEANGEPATVKSDMFIDRNRILYRGADDTDYVLIDKNSEQASSIMKLFDKAVSKEISELAKAKLENASVEDNADGSKTLSGTVDPDNVKELLDVTLTDLDYFEKVGASDVKFEFKSVSVANTISEDGKLTADKLNSEYNLSMKIGDKEATASVKAEITIDFTNLGQTVEIEFPEAPEVYTLYNPYTKDHINKSELKLRENGTFEITYDTESSNLGMKIRTISTEHGDFKYNEDKTRITGEGKYFNLKTLLDSETDKYTLRSYLQNAAESDPENKLMYDLLLKSLSDEGYEGDADDVDELKKLISVGVRENSEIILDRETMTAYVTLSGVDLKENQYYIASEELCLTLNEDGTCVMYGKYANEDEELGKYVMHYTDKGTYEKNEMLVKLSITSGNTKLVFEKDSSLTDYKKMYTEAFEGGYIARVQYEYYMDLVMEDGYTEEKEEAYTVRLEPHTQTAVPVDSDETER